MSTPTFALKFPVDLNGQITLIPKGFNMRSTLPQTLLRSSKHEERPRKLRSPLTLVPTTQTASQMTRMSVSPPILDQDRSKRTQPRNQRTTGMWMRISRQRRKTTRTHGRRSFLWRNLRKCSRRVLLLLQVLSEFSSLAVPVLIHTSRIYRSVW